MKDDGVVVMSTRTFPQLFSLKPTSLVNICVVVNLNPNAFRVGTKIRGQPSKQRPRNVIEISRPKCIPSDTWGLLGQFDPQHRMCVDDAVRKCGSEKESAGTDAMGEKGQGA
jgi:hypothetical protein